MRILVCVMELNLTIIQRINNRDKQCFYGVIPFERVEELIRKNYPDIKKAIAYHFEKWVGRNYKLSTGTYYKRQLTLNIYRGKFYFTFNSLHKNCNLKHSGNIPKHYRNKKYFNLEEAISILKEYVE